MNQPTRFQRLRPHLLAVLGLFALAAVYFLPALQGKVLPMADADLAQAIMQESNRYLAETGKRPLWTNALFSGMPAYMVAFEYPYTFVGTAVYKLINILPTPVNLLFVGLLGAYILFATLRFRPWLAVLGAVGYAFATYSLIYLDAGHVSKIFALAFLPGMLAGMLLALRGRYWAGGALFALFFCLQLAANHLQITYYTFMLLGIFAVFEAVERFRAGQLRLFGLGIATLVVAGLLAAGSYAERLMVTNQYAKETIRGRSELTAKTTAGPDVAQKKDVPKDGLDETYAFEYSYGLAESLSLLIPNFYGGGSNGGLGEGSELYKAMTAKGVDPAAALQFAQQAAPLYRGDMPIVGGPAYAGAVLLFLFVLGIALSRNSLRWPVLATALFMLSLAWGKNFFLNDIWFQVIPYFNKFRAMTMTLTLLQLALALGAALGLEALLDKPDWNRVKQPFFIALGATAGVCALLWIGGGALNWRMPNDVPFFTQYVQEGGFANELARAVADDRLSVMRADALRSLLFIALAAGLIWLFVKGRIKPAFLLPTLAGLVLIDLWVVDKRFVSNDKFVSKSANAATFQPTPADEQILADKDLSFRVFDQTTGITSNRASYLHASIGGYHAAKLRRYQDMLSYAFPQNTINILNMLNTRYVIAPGQPDAQGQPSAPVAQRNPDALGNGWFVQTWRTVPDPDAEMAALRTLNPRDTAVVDQRFADQLRGLPATLSTAGASIRLTSARPDHLVYETSNPAEGLAVFSEVYYRGDEDWNVTINGKAVPHLRANYILRALRIPAGQHKVEFKFEPPVVPLGRNIDLIANGLLILFLGAAVFFSLRPKKSSV